MTISSEPGTEHPERFEIIRGEVVPLMPTGDVHGIVEGLVFVTLHGAAARGAGLALVGEVGVVVESDPPTVRGADAAFLLASQLPYKKSREGYLLTAPALVAEVLSPNDRASEIQTKIMEYLRAGVLVVWIVDPASRTVAVHMSDGTARNLQSGDALCAPGVFGTLDTRVEALFEGVDLGHAPRLSQPPDS